MAKFILVITHLFIYASFSFGVSTTIPYEEIDSNKISDEKIEELSKTSKDHVLKSSENQISESELELLDVEFVLQSSDEIEGEEKKNTPSTYNDESPLCFPRNDNPLTNLLSDVQKAFPLDPPKNKHMIYFTWGYNRNFHSKSDATFTTNSGTFTIHDAIGYDRPSKDILDYVVPSRIPIPQYNLRVGYVVNDHWDIVAGLDHMKWVFQNQFQYEVTGDYNQTVFVPHESGDPTLLTGLTFDQVKETGDMRWLKFDHTNGYNYAHLGGIYKTNLFESRNGDFKIDSGLGAGAGLMIPQTTVKYHQGTWWNLQGVDNQFHVAGYGGHAEAKLQFQYKNFFLEPVVRGTYIKVSNALVQESGEKLEHTPIGSIQFIVQGGYKIPLSQRKKKIVPLN